MRERLIESRLTPNAISLTGFLLNLAAAGLVVERLFFLAGVAFIVGSVMDTLDGRYSRMSGKGTPFGAFLDSTLDRLEEGIVLTAIGAYFAAEHDPAAAAANLRRLDKQGHWEWPAKSGWPRDPCGWSSCPPGWCSPGARRWATSSCWPPRSTSWRGSAC